MVDLERLEEDDGSRWAISGRPLVYLCAACSSLCSILLGYDVGVMSGAKEYIMPDLGLSTVKTVSCCSLFLSFFIILVILVIFFFNFGVFVSFVVFVAFVFLLF